MAPSSFELILVGFILLLPFLYETSRTFRYYFKFMIYYGIVTCAAIILIPIFLLRPRNLKNLVLVLFFVCKRDTFLNLFLYIICYFCIFLFFFSGRIYPSSDNFATYIYPINLKIIMALLLLWDKKIDWHI